MYNRKEIKKKAKKTLKHHYIMIVALCLIGSFLLNGSLSISNAMTSGTSETTNEVSSSQMVGDDGILEFLDDLSAALDEEDSTSTSSTQEDPFAKIFGHENGVLAKIVNYTSSGSFFTTLATILNNFTNSSSITLAILILLSGLVYVLYTIFIYGIFEVSSRRMILEASEYEKVPLSHAFYTFFSKTNIKVALAELKYNFYSLLWWLTIVGGIIKTYSYVLVPYILAENPSLSGKQAITLSRKMMDGHKFEFFKLQLSMIGWFALNILTLGIAGILFVDPYKDTVYCEYYRWIRSISIENHVEGIELLNDTYLYEIASDEKLQVAYFDITEKQAYIKDNDIKLTGARKFFAENFALWIGSIRGKRAYQDIQNIKHSIAADKMALEKKSYPMRLSTLIKPSEKKIFSPIQYIRCYTIWTLILFFFLFSFIGWTWEVLLMLQQLGKFVNRGLLLGPWLPIYGTGGCIALLLLTRLRENPPLCFVGSVILSGILEYCTAWYLEVQYHQKWWDYTGYFLNLDGRICAEGLLVFGIGCSLVIYIVGPLFDSFLSKRSPKVIIPLAIILMVVFGCDAVYSHFHPNEGEGVTSSLHPQPILVTNDKKELIEENLLS